MPTDNDTQIFAGLPVRDLSAALDWYTAFFGRPADEVVGDEAMWQVAETTWLFIAPDELRSGGGLITLGVGDLEPYLLRWRAAGMAHQPVETYGNGVKHVTIVDPDGNSLSLASRG
ncbi:VOC family protein [Leucobacter tenebrionis]|uniref:VOC family protein n=1 Tax=Leucobacter tenebrionis TaxID=2873270 RepID=UPI001CA6DA85|nr:VOC family protein [Leucobacter tenebrionis]QZY52137.1 VOC family protein [Leucobacter tenebrionis]